MDSLYQAKQLSKIGKLSIHIVLNLKERINLKRIALGDLIIYYTWKNIKSYIKTTNLEY